MGNKETSKEEEFLGSAEEVATFGQTMFAVADTLEISGKVLLPHNGIPQKPSLSPGRCKK
jgi:hypothetical protein